ncbi:TIGR02234 family membrane protein [Microlunatus panaciterrae]|uniref:Membrane protein (TIGR02234 family) n=1 Tax=Microlunatus panaciterrae TaxID=400768 RepID=A0ABS2REA4_9ACTN|nr:Trp biosynthesis-associated membrane protein [Microlunatus panaciterrae]MBM7797321.1 putative membrane protein (TIGR02234 family) [Microlunatus panaciterrae]
MRSRAVALGGAAIGGVLALISSSRPWWRAAAEGTGVAFTGSDVSAGLTQALAVVVLAGVLLALTLRSRGRRVLGVILALIGAGAVVVGLLRLRPSPVDVQTRLREVTLLDQYALTATAWPQVFACAGLLVLVGAVLMVVRSDRWPQRTDWFQRTAVADEPPADQDPAVLWKALDAGIDPTTPPDETSARISDRMGRDSSSTRPPGIDAE